MWLINGLILLLSELKLLQGANKQSDKFFLSYPGKQQEGYTKVYLGYLTKKGQTIYVGIWSLRNWYPSEYVWFVADLWY